MKLPDSLPPTYKIRLSVRPTFYTRRRLDSEFPAARQFQSKAREREKNYTQPLFQNRLQSKTRLTTQIHLSALSSHHCLGGGSSFAICAALRSRRSFVRSRIASSQSQLARPTTTSKQRLRNQSSIAMNHRRRSKLCERKLIRPPSSSSLSV